MDTHAPPRDQPGAAAASVPAQLAVRVGRRLDQWTPQPLVGGITLSIAMAVLGAAWRFLPLRHVDTAAVVTAMLLGMTVVEAYRFPLHVGRHIKLQLATAPYYLMAALLAPPLAAIR